MLLSFGVAVCSACPISHQTAEESEERGIRDYKIRGGHRSPISRFAKALVEQWLQQQQQQKQLRCLNLVVVRKFW